MLGSKRNGFKNLIVAYQSQTVSQKHLFLLYTFLLIPYSITIMMAVGVRFGLSGITPFFKPLFISVAVLLCSKSILKQVRSIDVFFILFIIALYYISKLIFPDTAPFSEENANYFIFTCLPMYFVGLTIKNNTSCKMFVILAYLALFLQIVYLLVLGMGENETGEMKDEQMTTAYNLLPFILFLLWYAFDHGSVGIYLSAAIGVFVLFSLGTRGPVLCMFSFIVFYFLLFRRYKRNYLVKVLIVLLGGILFLFTNDIAFFLGKQAESLGLSTRVFDSFIENEMIDIGASNGRDIVWGETLRYLTEKRVFLGEGLYSDRIINGNGIYSHNLELELLCSFGLIGGIIVLTLLVGLIIKAFKSGYDKNGSIIMLVFFCSSIMQLQFSSSFMQSMVFWLFLGICVSVCRVRETRY